MRRAGFHEKEFKLLGKTIPQLRQLSCALFESAPTLLVKETGGEEPRGDHCCTSAVNADSGRGTVHPPSVPFDRLLPAFGGSNALTGEAPSRGSDSWSSLLDGQNRIGLSERT